MIKSMFLSSNIPDEEKNMERKVICFYIDLLNRILGLKIKDLRFKKDIKHPLLTEGDGNAAGITVFETFARKNRESWDVSKQHKEAITARIILLIFRLENYRPLGVKSLTKNLTMAQKTVTQVGNELGCHLNKTKNASGSHDVLELKLPLFKPRLARNKRR